MIHNDEGFDNIEQLYQFLCAYEKEKKRNKELQVFAITELYVPKDVFQNFDNFQSRRLREEEDTVFAGMGYLDVTKEMDKYLKKWLNFETKEEKKELLDKNIPYVYGKKLYAATPFWNAQKKYKQHDFITDKENIDFEDLQSFHVATEEGLKRFIEEEFEDEKPNCSVSYRIYEEIKKGVEEARQEGPLYSFEHGNIKSDDYYKESAYFYPGTKSYYITFEGGPMSKVGIEIDGEMHGGSEFTRFLKEEDFARFLEEKIIEKEIASFEEINARPEIEKLYKKYRLRWLFE